VSYQASEWACRAARTGSSSAKSVLMVMAEVADPVGCGVRLSQKSIAERSELTERTVRRAWVLLEEKGFIRRGDQRLVAHLPASHRPIVWDLDLTLEVAAEPTSRPDTVSPQTGHSDPSDRTEIPPCADTESPHPRTESPVTTGQDVPSPPDTVSDKASLEPSLEPSVEPSSFSSPKTAKRRRKPETALPDSWRPNDSHNKLARELGLSTEEARFELDQFRDHAQQNDRRCRDWDAAFRNWLRIAAKRNNGNRRRPARAATIAAAEATKHSPDPELMRRAWPSQNQPAQLRAIPGGLA